MISTSETRDWVSYVKSPVASLTFVCSSVKKRVRVTMLVLTLADSDGGISPFPLEAMMLRREYK